MINAEDIKLLVASGEGYNIEFKQSIPSKMRELACEVCAFANAAGGVLLIGVDDNNEVKGITVNNGKRSAIQDSLNEITPHLSCKLDFVEVDGKTVGVIEVPSGPNRPYVLSGAIYIRSGPNSQKLTTVEQMREFFHQAGKIHFDEGSCKSFNPMVDLDENVYALFCREARLEATISKEQ